MKKIETILIYAGFLLALGVLIFVNVLNQPLPTWGKAFVLSLGMLYGSWFLLVPIWKPETENPDAEEQERFNALRVSGWVLLMCVLIDQWVRLYVY